MYVCVSFFEYLIAYWPPLSATTLSYFSLMIPALSLPTISGNYALFRE